MLCDGSACLYLVNSGQWAVVSGQILNLTSNFQLLIK